MSYFRGDTYLWSDGEALHLWTRRSYSPANESYSSGVSIPESVMDRFATMRFAELLQNGQAHAAIEAALKSGNSGSACLRMHSAALLDFIDAFETSSSSDDCRSPPTNRNEP